MIFFFKKHVIVKNNGNKYSKQYTHLSCELNNYTKLHKNNGQPLNGMMQVSQKEYTHKSATEMHLSVSGPESCRFY